MAEPLKCTRCGCVVGEAGEKLILVSIVVELERHPSTSVICPTCAEFLKLWLEGSGCKLKDKD